MFRVVRTESTERQNRWNDRAGVMRGSLVACAVRLRTMWTPRRRGDRSCRWWPYGRLHLRAVAVTGGIVSMSGMPYRRPSLRAACLTGGPSLWAAVISGTDDGRAYGRRSVICRCRGIGDVGRRYGQWLLREAARLRVAIVTGCDRYGRPFLGHRTAIRGRSSEKRRQECQRGTRASTDKRRPEKQKRDRRNRSRKIWATTVSVRASRAC